MDRVRNPFTPGAGSRPPLLVGRDPQLDSMTVAMRRLSIGRFERSLLLTGLRGVGKTVLLNEFGRVAEGEDWIRAHVEATDDVHLPTALASIARRTLLELSVIERSKVRAGRALRTLRGFIKVHVPIGDGSSLSIDLDPLPGRADTGELETDLANVLVDLGETAAAAGRGVLITVDEMQYLPRQEFSVLIVALHRISQDGLPLLVAGAGLPSLPGLAGEARSYAERLFAYVDIGRLDDDDARRALVEPVEGEGGHWEPRALDRAILETQGFPYFLQEYGKQGWNVAAGPAITSDEMDAAALLARDELDQGFFRVRIDRTTDAERDYLRAMAAVGGVGPYRSGDVSRVMGRSTTQNGPVRDSVIKRGLCYAPRHGEIAYTVPMFDDYVRRRL